VRRKLKRFRVLIFALSILMPFFLAYRPNERLGEIRFLSPNPTLVSLEAADQEDLAIDSPAPSKGIISASHVILSHLGIHSFKNFIPFLFRPFFFQQKTLILRC
jgi:hypothetical protein